MAQRLLGAVRPAYDMAEVQVQVMSEFSPTLGFSHRDDIVKTLPRGASEQVGDEQFAVTKTSRSFFVSQRCRSYPGLVGDRTQNASFSLMSAAPMVNAVCGPVKLRLIIRPADCHTKQQQ